MLTQQHPTPPPPEPNRQPPQYTRPLFLTTILALALCLGLTTLGFLFYYYNSPPTTTENLTHATNTYRIRKYTFGDARKVFYQMQNDRIIRSAAFALRITTLLGYDKRIQKGVYQFSNNLSTLAIIHLLITGQQETTLFPLIEGYDIYDIDNALLSQQLIPTKGDFITFAHAKNTLHTIKTTLELPPKISPVSAEGFLAPNSYQLRLSTPKKDLLYLALNEFKTQLLPVLKENSPPHNWLPLMTIGSLIEKETSLPNEKPLIAAVIFNRLNANMKLRYDPSIIYALKKANVYENFLTPDGAIDIKRQHFTFPSPYNTYYINGLPRSPISSFTRASLLAAHFPAKSNFLFFVARKQGDHSAGHDFSLTYEEHRKKIKRYQR